MWCKQIPTESQSASVPIATMMMHVLVHCQVKFKRFTRHIKFDPQVMGVALRTNHINSLIVSIMTQILILAKHVIKQSNDRGNENLATRRR